MNFKYLFGSLLLSFGALARAQCTHYVPVHEIVSSTDGIYTFNDEGGARQISATVHASADCDRNPARFTGAILDTNRTSLSQMAVTETGCEIKEVNGNSVIDSFQAIVINSNGWLMNNVNFNYGDMDASGGGWMEAGAVVGVRDGTLVFPTFALSSDTVLELRDMVLPAATTSQLGVGSGEITVPGFRYALSEVFSCPIDGPQSGQQQCNAVVSFSSPVDTIAIVYAVLERGKLSSRSAGFVTELRMNCGCRCRQTSPGPRMAAAAIPGVTGECASREITSPRTECDVLGTQWCARTDLVEYILTGAQLPNGNFACTSRDGQRVSVQSAFTPDASFSQG